MKKLILAVAIILMIILASVTLITGIHIGGFQALGLAGMKEKNTQVDNKIEQASKLTSTDYPKKMSEITSSSKELLTAKEEYQDLTNYSTDSAIAQVNELPEYEVEFLWKQIGEHATKEGINLKMEIASASVPTTVDGRKQYNLNFTTTGSYIGIASFISALENDSSLEFKIENFKMLPVNNELQATFMVKDVPIKLNQLSSGSSVPTQEGNQNTNGTSQNNTNQTNNTTNTNNTTTGS